MSSSGLIYYVPVPAPPAFDPSFNTSQLIINGQTISADVTAALSDAQIDLTMNGASTVTLTLQDPFRTLVNSPLFNEIATISITGTKLGFSQRMNFDLVAIAKQGDVLTATFEDHLIHLLRATVSPPGGLALGANLTRAQFAQQIVASVAASTSGGAAVPIQAPPPGPFAQVDTNTSGTETWGGTSYPDEDAWSCLTRLANEVQWRVFSDGQTIWFGPDYWLLSFPTVATLSEFSGGVQSIDFEWDSGQAEAQATITMQTGLISFGPGMTVVLKDVGIASTGPPGQSGVPGWLVSDMSRSLFLPDATVTCVWPLPEISESTLAGENSGTNTSGVPQTEVPIPNNVAQTTKAANAVSVAMAQVGKPYVYGAAGPGAFDCSGLVQYAYAQVGITIPRDTYEQWDAAVAGTNNMAVVGQNTIAGIAPGDLIYVEWDEGGVPGPGHVGMYVGNGQVVEAPHSPLNVMVVSLSTFLAEDGGNGFGVARVT